MLIFGVEHFVQEYHGFSCLGVPIHLNDEIIGAFDISVPNELADPGRLNIVQACVAAIESTLNFWSFSDETTRPLPDPTLISSIIHDIKNPLAAIRGLVQLSNLHHNDPYLQKAIDQVDKLTGQLNGWIRSLGFGALERHSVSQVLQEIVDIVMPQCLLLFFRRCTRECGPL